MLRKVGPGGHLVVASAALVLAGLGAAGVIGGGDQGLLRPEHFDAKQVTVFPAGPGHPDGVRIREVVDIDFGVNERRGYQRIVPQDFGEPTDVVADSPDANSDLGVVDIGFDTRIRLGDPSITFTGQHRYLLEYTLPDAQLSSGVLALDVIGHEETFVTDEFTVVVTGFEFAATECDVGAVGAFGGCRLTSTGPSTAEVVFEPLAPGDGITITGEIEAIVDPDLPPLPDLPGRNPSGIRPLGFVLLAVGAVIAFFGYRRFHRLGSNVVYGDGGAADAAFGELPVPRSGDPVHDVVTHRVPDARLADLATIEFVPPRGLEPWHGRVLLRERVDDGTVSAWFSEMVAQEAIEIEVDDGEASALVRGNAGARLAAVDRRHLDALFALGDRVELGTYRATFAAVWDEIESDQRDLARESGWWDPPLGAPLGRAGRAMGTVLLLVFAGVVAANFLPAWFPTVHSTLIGRLLLGPVGAIVLTTLAMMLVVSGAYGVMLPSRTAIGSALTLRTESFRRFLASSEGRHVDWAWEHGLIREYSAWAVALDAADAWSEAIESSNVPEPSVALSGPLLVHSHASSFSSSHTAPSSSGGSGGGSGGGGGGGSSGSW